MASDKGDDDVTDAKDLRSNRATPGNSFYGDNDETAQSPFPPVSSARPSSMPPAARSEPFGFPRPAGPGLLSSFMPGFNPFSAPSTPLLPSNLFTPAPMHSRIPMFRPYFPPPSADDEDSMEEFMEIEKNDSSKLEELVKKMEPTLKDPNQCAICKRILSCKSALQMHYRTHTGERPFRCKICGRAFTTKGNLKTHMSVHRTRPSGQMNHQCPVCNKQFSNILLLQEHVRMHVGDMNKHGIPKFPMVPPMPPNFMQMMGFPPLMPPNFQLPKLSPSSMDITKAPTDFRDEFPLVIKPEMKTPHKVCSSPERPTSAKRPADEESANERKKQKEDAEETLRPVDVKTELFPPTRTQTDKVDPAPSSGSLFALQESVKEMDRMIHTPSQSLSMLDPLLYPSPSPKQTLYEGQHSRFRSGDKSPSRCESPKSSHAESSAPTPVITHTGTPTQSLPASRPITSSSATPPACPTSPFRSRRESLRHVCQVCHKPFSSGSALQIHMRTHTGERPFKCTVCSKGFTTKGNAKCRCPCLV